MNIAIYGTSSCALQELTNIRYFSDPESIMLSFCKQTLGTATEDIKADGGYAHYVYNKPLPGNVGNYTNGLGDLYVFTGVENTWSDKEVSTTIHRRFAAWIEENDLGKITMSGLANNHRYHSTHWSRAYIWIPNRAKVFAWWKANKAKQDALDAKKAADQAYYKPLPQQPPAPRAGRADVLQGQGLVQNNANVPF